MIRNRERMMQMAGIACLLCMGLILLISAGQLPRLRLLLEGPAFPYVHLVQPWILLGLTIAAAVIFGVLGRRRSAVERFCSLALLAGLLAVVSSALLPGRDAPAEVDRYRRTVAELEQVRAEVTELDPTLLRVAHAIRIDWRAGVPASNPAGAALFERISDWPGLWSKQSGLAALFPLRVVLWHEGQRVAWTPGADPATRGEATLPALGADPERAQELEILDTGRGGLLRRVVELEAGWLAELQLPVRGDELEPARKGFGLEIVAKADLPVRLDAEGEEVPDAVWIDERTELALRVTHSGPDEEWRPLDRRARLVLWAVTLWGLLALVTSSLLLGRWGPLLSLWTTRAVMAGAGYFRLAGSTVFGLEFPARPASLASLLDPAYFATPFLFGGLATAADALLTAALLFGTVAWLLQRRSGPSVEDAPAPSTPADRWSSGVGDGLALGILAAALLSALWVLTVRVADNSNARLIGEGVSLSSVTFWVMHTVLMLAGLGLLSIVPCLWRPRLRWSRRQASGRWTGTVVAALAAIATTAPWGGLGWKARVVLGLASAALYWIVPALHARPRWLRRLAWPLLLLVSVGWNYLSLSEVYDRAERAWLERKGELITESSEDWMLFLLQDTLKGMITAEPELASALPADDELWRDEAAYRLWEDSALRDLGYSCLVELIAADENEESLFATGQMRDFEFKVAGRSPWLDAAGVMPGPDWDLVFQIEDRIYVDGRETVLAGEGVRRGGRGWIRIEVPVKTDRLSSLQSTLAGPVWPSRGNYQPRAEVDRPILLLRGGPDGWRSADAVGYPDEQSEQKIRDLQSGRTTWAVLHVGQEDWLGRWERLPADWSEDGADEEGFLLGVRRPGVRAVLLDLSRLVLLNLLLYVVILGVIRFSRWLLVRGSATGSATGNRGKWSPGFQERFLAGYLLLGLVLLAVVGGSVDQVGRDRIRREARQQTLDGLELAVQQLRSLLVEQARSLAGSEYIGDLLLGHLAGQRPVGPFERQQGMVFDGDGTLLLDETLSDLSPREASDLLTAGRSAPLLLIQEEDRYYAATVIPIDLGGIWAAAEGTDSTEGVRHGADDQDGFFLYRQRLDAGLLRGLAELARGEATLRYDGRPIFASHPSDIFAGIEPLLMEPERMIQLLRHPHGPMVFDAGWRSFAYTGCQPLPAFGRDSQGHLLRRAQPAVLALAFPDRAREFTAQRRETVLFLAGLANLILLTALVLAWLLSWNIFRPLRLLLSATRSLGRGDFDAPLPEPGADEVGRLAGAFDLMRGELSSARDRLAARERFLTTVLDRVTVGVAVLDRRGELRTVNPAGREILAQFEPAGDEASRARQLQQRLGEAAEGGSRWSGELRSGDGRRTLRGAIAPLDLPGEGADTMLVFEDVTEFLQTKMMAVNAELARQVAHEIKNPLTPIQLSIQLLDQAWRDGHDQLDRIVRDTVSRVLEQVALLRAIAAEFSLLGRPGELEIEPLDFAAVAGRCVAAYADPTAAVTGEGPRVTIAEGPGALVLGHEDSLQKILGNLMQNSLDAAPEGTPARIDIDWVLGPESVTLRWRDHGAGIADEVADRLFDPYFSTKSSGTGLGLAICRNLADRMGGRIELGTPLEGAGALAELTMPRVQENGVDG